MGIVLNEREWAESALAARSLGKRPVETLSRIARYYYQCEGYSKKDIRGKLEDFLIQCDPDVVLMRWENTINRVVKSSGKYKIIEIDGFDITQNEMNTIQSIQGRQPQRIAFVLLCAAKYWNAAQPSNNNWVNLQDKEIMSLANVNTSSQRQNMIFHDLKNRGLIRFGRRVDSLNIQVQFMDESGEVALHVDDLRNLGNQYMLYCGEPYFRCANCGLTLKRRSNSNRYCPDCASEMYIRKTVESVMRNRAAVNQ